MSSLTRPGYSASTSSSVAPQASNFRINSTVKRVPLITGFPAITARLETIRYSNSSFILARSREHYTPTCAPWDIAVTRGSGGASVKPSSRMCECSAPAGRRSRLGARRITVVGGKGPKPHRAHPCAAIPQRPVRCIHPRETALLRGCDERHEVRTLQRLAGEEVTRPYVIPRQAGILREHLLLSRIPEPHRQGPFRVLSCLS